MLRMAFPKVLLAWSIVVSGYPSVALRKRGERLYLPGLQPAVSGLHLLCKKMHARSSR